ncbi:MAG: hypothetical protein EBR82_26390 [Caulobacteraceae bacterium]|nr:hypothetical protein [Caulobacteraceae bacterium]
MSQYPTQEHVNSVKNDPDPLTNRLRGIYTNPGGKRTFPVAPIQIAAADEIDRLAAENARLRAVVEAAKHEISAWRTAEDESRAIENAYGLNTARAYIARARDAFDAALSALDAKENV